MIFDIGPLGAMRPIGDVRPSMDVAVERPSSSLTVMGGRRLVQSGPRAQRAWTIDKSTVSPESVAFLQACADGSVVGDLYAYFEGWSRTNLLPPRFGTPGIRGSGDLIVSTGNGYSGTDTPTPVFGTVPVYGVPMRGARCSNERGFDEPGTMPWSDWLPMRGGKSYTFTAHGHKEDGAPYAAGSVLADLQISRGDPAASVRVNRSVNPRAAGVTSGATMLGFATYNPGPGETGTTTAVLEAADGPVMPDGTRIRSYARRSIVTPKTSGSTGWRADGDSLRVPFAGVAGTPFGVALYVRFSAASDPGVIHRTVRLRGTPYLGTVAGTFTDSAAVVMPMNEWVRIETAGLAAEAFDKVGWWLYHTSGSNLPGGSTLDVTAALIEEASPVGPYFDGSTSDGKWDAEPFYSASRMSGALDLYPAVAETLAINARGRASFVSPATADRFRVRVRAGLAQTVSGLQVVEAATPPNTYMPGEGPVKVVVEDPTGSVERVWSDRIIQNRKVVIREVG